MNQHETEMNEEGFEIDIYAIINNLWRGVIKFYWLVIVLAIISSGAYCWYMVQSYTPKYTASATFTVSLNIDSDGSIFEDNIRASQMSATFPYILTSGVLKDIIANDLGVSSVSEAITAENVADTNLFTIKVTSYNPQWSYKVLQSVIKNYPKVAVTVVGDTHLNMIEETGIPKEPVNPLNYGSNIKIGVLPGLAIGIIIIFLYAITRRTIHKLDDLTGLTSIKHLGILPEVIYKKRKNNANSIALYNDKLPYFYQENIYKIRIRVEKIALSKGMKSILVTSAIPGEGKSTIAYNLALAIAEEGKKVALLDFDLRRPNIKNLLPKHKEFIGFEKYLNHEVELKDALVYFEELKISVLACSEPIKNSAEIIGTPEISNILSELKASFDYIILDTAPSAILSDTLDLAKYVDGAVFVIKQDYTKVNHILESLEHLSECSNTEIIGCVLNCVRDGIDHYGYGYDYGYGSYGGYKLGRKKQGETAIEE